MILDNASVYVSSCERLSAFRLDQGGLLDNTREGADSRCRYSRQGLVADTNSVDRYADHDTDAEAHPYAVSERSKGVAPT